MTKIYCLKCKTFREIKNEHKEKINGRNILKGVCKHCGTKVSKFI